MSATTLCRQHARHVLGDAAAGDVRHALDGDALHQAQQRLHVQAGGGHDAVGQRALAVEFGVEVGLAALDDLAHQRIAVGVRAVGSEAQHHVAGLDVLAGDDLALFHHAHRKAGEVVFAHRIHAGHLGGLAADQRAAGLLATVGDALDHFGGGRHVELAAGEVVEEEQRLGALHQDVVHAHRDQVDADGVVAVQLESELEFGAHAVGAGYQHRLLVFFGDLDQAAEAADAAQDFGAHGALGKGFDVLDQLISGVDVDARVAVGQAVGGGAQVEFSLSRR